MRSISVQPVDGGKNILIDGQVVTVRWSPTVSEDLFAYHGLNIEMEIMRSLFKELEPYNLNEEERLELVRLIKSKE